ncbi:WXG100 protein secretion system (Wss), protein YukC [Thermoactinomyces sp. DSM 45891]|uniref:type VII secretion protein EssB/YukC n=1 Tax=Thermoactinomyces sp. DSM 45891 TaxID=1761907 RepID=UPI00091CA072|nr:type VII secretion protein EssB/YukC [Thermoactinomyces sp. DSM 45891]SFX80631.1 WXG100 protein secretion system (Wss), protein YukC [Thermoactinomyces sp. DSM 45891]
MKKMLFNHGTLIFDRDSVQFEIPLKSLKSELIDGSEIDVVKKVSSEIAFPCTYSITDDMLIMHFDIEEDFLPFESVRAVFNLGRDEKLKMVEDLINLGEYFEDLSSLNTVFDTLNLFGDSNGRVKLLFRGVREVLPAEGYESESVFDQIKRLVLFLFTEARYDVLRIQGNKSAIQKTNKEDRQIVRKIIEAETYQDLKNGLGISQLVADHDEIHDHSEMGQEQEEQVVLKEKPIVQKIKTEKPVKTEKPIKTKKPRKQWTLKPVYLLGATVLVVVVASVLYMTSGSGSGAKSQKVEASEKTSANGLLKGMRLAAMQQFKEAAKQFEQLKFHDLDKEDQKVVLLTFLLSGEEQKAIELEPKFVESVISYYVTNNQLDKVKNLKSDLPVVQFEIAVLDKKPETVIELKSKVRMDGRREKIVVEAFLTKGDFEGAYDFARTTGNSDLTEFIQKREKGKKDTSTGTNVS